MPKEPTILLIEESSDDVFIIRHALEAAGINNPVRVAWGGKEAIAYLNGEGNFASREDFPLPGLVLLELNLTGFDGLKVLRWIRQQPRFESLRVVVLTASLKVGAVSRSLRLGAAAVFSKPGNVTETVCLMKIIQAQWLTLVNEPGRMAAPEEYSALPCGYTD